MTNIILEALRELNLIEAKQDIDNFIDKFGSDNYELFKKSTQRLKNNNISTDLVWHIKHTEKKELENILNNLQNRTIVKDLKSDKFEGKYDYLGEDKGYKVYHVKDHIASMNLGAGTGWCISGRYGHYGDINYRPTETEAKKHWNNYTKKGIEFYFFIGSNDKYALALYPGILNVEKISGDIYLKETNFELYDERDNLNYADFNKLPYTLIAKEVIIESLKSQDGLFINDNVIEIADPKITKVIIPNSITSIGRWAFKNCHNLKSIEISNSVTSIGEYAFFGCSSLTSVEIPDSVTSIGEYAFSGCKNLTNITLPEGLISIDNATFEYCIRLTNINIPSNVISIGRSAFQGCSSLTSITIPNSVTNIGKSIFNGCSRLTSVTIPDNVTSISDRAFANCSSLKSITIPNNVTSIGDSTFYGCRSLISITIPDSVTSIECFAFGCCYNLTNIEIPNSITNIRKQTFLFCTHLTSIIIPDSVTNIDDEAFQHCEELTNVYYTGTKEQWSNVQLGNYNRYLLKAKIHYNYNK